MKKIQRIVLLGTGTDVGKTYVGSQLAKAWKAECGPVLGLKPIESGIEQSNKTLQGDAASLGACATSSRWPRYALAEPISPHLAARREGLEIDIQEVALWVAKQESEFIEDCAEDGEIISIVETAGGAFSPVSASSTNADLARALSPALWILVAPDSLGVLHDVQATLRALPDRQVDLVALSRARGEDASTGTNAAEISGIVCDQLAGLAPRFSEVPTVERDGDAQELLALVRRALSSGE